MSDNGESELLRMLASMQKQLDAIQSELAVTKQQVIAAHAQILRNADIARGYVAGPCYNYHADAERARRGRG